MSSSKSSGSGVLEEDEGFSDWTQRLGQDRRLRLENGRSAAPEAEWGMNGAAKHAEKMRFTSSSSSSSATSARLQSPPQEKENQGEVKAEEEDMRLGSRLSEKRRKEFGRKEYSQTDREIQQNGKALISPIKKGGESPIADVDEKVGTKEPFMLKYYYIPYQTVKLITVTEM